VSEISDRNVEVMRAGYKAFKKEGVEAILPLLDPEIEWIALTPPPMNGTYRGHDGVREFFRKLGEFFEDERADADEFIPVGDDQVLVFLRLWARGTISRVEGQVPLAMLWKVGPTSAVQVKVFYDRGEALTAAGLEPRHAAEPGAQQ
jgi:ketosteroid isomerase-like protein